MRIKTSLRIILIISVAGLLFSGYLSYTELFAGYCGASELGMGSCTSIVSIPACVYGFIMYLAVFVIAVLGLREKN